MLRFDAVFEGTPIQLLGGVVDSEGAHPGEPIEVSFFWRALEPVREDPVAFIQILGRGGEPIAGEDCYPGRGNFPATLWEPGVVYRDRYVLMIAPDAEAPTIAALHAGLHWLDGPRLAPLYPSGDPVLQPVLFDLVALRPIRPLSADAAYPVGARIGDAITLVGYDLSAEEAHPGETLDVTLVWRAEAVPEGDYTVFVHLIDEGGNLVAQDDHPPLDDQYRTTFWAPGDVVRDTYHLALDSDQPPCTCTLLVGMYDAEADARVLAFDGVDGRFADDAVIAGGVTVE